MALVGYRDDVADCWWHRLFRRFLFVSAPAGAFRSHFANAHHFYDSVGIVHATLTFTVLPAVLFSIPACSLYYRGIVYVLRGPRIEQLPWWAAPAAICSTTLALIFTLSLIEDELRTIDFGTVYGMLALTWVAVNVSRQQANTPDEMRVVKQVALVFVFGLFYWLMIERPFVAFWLLAMGATVLLFLQGLREHRTVAIDNGQEPAETRIDAQIASPPATGVGPWGRCPDCGRFSVVDTGGPSGMLACSCGYRIPVRSLVVGSLVSQFYHRTTCAETASLAKTDAVLFGSSWDASLRGYRRCELCGPPAVYRHAEARRNLGERLLR